MSGFNYKDWYEKNKAEINQRRRSRYASDPEYREKQRVATKRWKDAQREARKALGPRKRSRSVTMKLEGREVEMHTIGVFSERIGKSVITIREWERQGFLPETPFRSSRGDRLYTDEMIDVVRVIVGGRATVDLKDEGARRAISDGWRNTGVPL